MHCIWVGGSDALDNHNRRSGKTMVEVLRATRFELVMKEGRTHPVVLGCRSRDASPARSILCKAIGCPDLGATWQMVAEVVGNLAAQRMGILTPQPFVVEISETTAKLVNYGLSELGYTFEVQAGLAAGCEFIPSITPWAHGAKWESRWNTQAARLFVFDMLTQNPDRRREKVNCGFLKNSIIAFDFEFCFSHRFLPILGENRGMGQLSRLGMAENHLLYDFVRVAPPEPESIREWMAALSPVWWTSVREGLPDSWQGAADVIGDEFYQISEQAEDFIEDLLVRCLA